jgi:hypothetical protein
MRLSDHLGLHSIESFEIFSRVSDQRTVARMIDRFHAGYGFHFVRLMLVNMLNQLGLGIGRAGDENGIGVREGFGDGAKVLMIRGGVSAPDRIGLAMDMFGRMVWMDDKPFDIGPVEVENARLLVIDPDDGVMMMSDHVLNPCR